MLRDIDKIYCINLYTSLDRKKEFIKNFPELVDMDIFEWYNIDRDSKDPVRGCYNSHKNILDMARKKNYSKIIIFEDDAVLLRPWEKFVSTINNIKYPDDWKSILLGYFPYRTKRVQNIDTVVHIVDSVCTACHIFNPQTLIVPEYNKIPIDLFLYSIEDFKDFGGIIPRKIKDGMYGIYPHMLIGQEKKFNSTIGNDKTNESISYDDIDERLQTSTLIDIRIFYALKIFFGVLSVLAMLIILVFIIKYLARD